MDALRSLYVLIELKDQVTNQLRRVNDTVNAFKNRIESTTKPILEMQNAGLQMSRSLEAGLESARYLFAQMDLVSREAVIRSKHASKPVQELALAFDRAKMRVQMFADSARQKIKEAARVIEEYKWAVVGAGAALSAFAYGGYRFFREATKDLADFQDAMRVFRNRTGENADAILKAMEEAAGGTLDATQLILNANRAMAMGIDPQYLPKMMEIARAAARNMGTDVQYMFESIVLGTARQSKLILDNLGIIVQAEEAYEKYAKTLGKTASQLTEAEKRQAFINAVLEAGEDIVKYTDLSQKSLNEEIQRATVAWQEFKRALAEGALPVISGVIDGIKSLTAWLRDLPKPVKAVIGTLGVLATAVSAVVGPLLLQTAAFAFLTTKIAEFGGLAAIIASVKAAVVGFASSTIAAIAPLLPAILAISAAVLLLQHAWVHNWGGIREAAAKVVEGLRWAFGGLVSITKTFISGLIEPLRFLFSPILEALGMLNEEAGKSKILVSIVDAISGAFRWLYSVLEPHIPLIKQIIRLVGIAAGVALLITNPIGQVILLISGVAFAIRAAVPWIQKVTGSIGNFVHWIQQAVSSLGPLKYALLGPAGALIFLAQNFSKLQSIASAALSTLRGVWDRTIGWIITKISEFIAAIQSTWKAISENPLFKAAETLFNLTPIGMGIKATKTVITEHHIPSLEEIMPRPAQMISTIHSPKIEHKQIHAPISIRIEGVRDPDKVAELVEKKLQRQFNAMGVY